MRYIIIVVVFLVLFSLVFRRFICFSYSRDVSICSIVCVLEIKVGWGEFVYGSVWVEVKGLNVFF